MDSTGEERVMPEYDAVVIGAGLSGLRVLRELRDEVGLSVKVFEAGTEVGGTWFWNRYPGARTDTESWAYGLSFDKDLLEDWDWEEASRASRRSSATSTTSPTASTCVRTSPSRPRSPRPSSTRSRAPGGSPPTPARR
jgi:cation diffusion facilitator CzcD-associated flavoprotein CzcO